MSALVQTRNIAQQHFWFGHALRLLQQNQSTYPPTQSREGHQEVQVSNLHKWMTLYSERRWLMEFIMVMVARM
ncbi:hypothetical protein SAMN05443246_5173 [Paenibacillus sp. GP183]|nr:hypothetical protein SAMN05443246_5173 [Paenibacillus sp. GP183]